MPKKIDEASMSRLYIKLTNDSKLGIISPFRDDEESENHKRMRKLKSTANKLGYGFSQLVDKWVEDGETYVEESLIIYGINKKQLLSLGKEYDQTSVIYKDGEECTEYLTTPRGEFENGNFGDVIRRYDLAGDNILNIEKAKEIFASRRGGPASKLIKGSNQQPWNLNLKEEYKLYKKVQPRPSYFQTDYSFIRLL